ncbi:acyl--CoA ligase [Phaeobacter sp. CNT1-3]|nr:acyl--CoA ligase [Phaeobacter sp. CNT1-3]
MKRLHELVQRQTVAAQTDTVPQPTPSLAVIDYDERRYSYCDLDRLSDVMAERLTAHGARAGDRVIVLSENCATHIVAILALSKLNAWIVFMNARVTDTELDRVLNASGARCIIYTPEVSPSSAKHADTFGGVDLGQLDCGKLLVSPVRDVAVEPLDDSDEQVCAMFYTTGTTGAPKGVMLSHANLLFMAQASAQLRSLSPQDQLLSVLPGTHVFAFGSSLLSVLNAGATIRLMPRFDPTAVLTALTEGATLFSAVPQMYALLLKQLKTDGLSTAPNTLRYMSSGGAPLDPSWKQEVQNAFGCHLHNGYGMTEASPIVAATGTDEQRSDTSVGRALAGTEVIIHNPNAEGVGEVWLRGPNVMKGYYGNPEATAETITADGFLRTGDLATMDPDGALHLVGRCKELIIHSGFNVYPPEVEAALNAHPNIVHSAVVGRARNGNEDVLGFVTLRDPDQQEDLRNWLRDKLAPYKIPLHIVVADALPQASTGKILKAKLLPVFDAELTELDKGLDA